MFIHLVGATSVAAKLVLFLVNKTFTTLMYSSSSKTSNSKTVKIAKIGWTFTTLSFTGEVPRTRPPDSFQGASGLGPVAGCRPKARLPLSTWGFDHSESVEC